MDRLDAIEAVENGTALAPLIEELAAHRLHALGGTTVRPAPVRAGTHRRHGRICAALEALDAAHVDHLLPVRIEIGDEGGDTRHDGMDVAVDGACREDGFGHGGLIP